MLEQVGPVAGADEGSAFGQVSATVFVLSDAGDGQLLVDVLDEDDTIDCVIEAFDLDDDVDFDLDEEEIEVDGTAARRFEADSGAVEVFVPVGRLLIDVQAFSEDDDRAEELLLDAASDLQDALRDGGA